MTHPTMFWVIEGVVFLNYYNQHGNMSIRHLRYRRSWVTLRNFSFIFVTLIHLSFFFFFWVFTLILPTFTFKDLLRRLRF